MAHLGFETGEAVSLFVALIGYLILLIEFKHQKNLLHLFLAYTLVLIGSISTVVESFYFSAIFNHIEHIIGSALAGIAFAVTTFLAHKKIVGLEGNVRRKIRSQI